MKETTVATKRESSLDVVRHFLRKYVADGAREWRLTPRMIVLITAIPFVVAFMGAGSALLGKDAYKWFTSEDGFAETLQVVFYFTAFVLSLIVARRQWRTNEKLISFLYIGLSLALVFMIGEETSWGQRIFGWDTDPALVEINKQDETNFHNIYGVGATFKWLQMVVGAYGVVLPLIFARWQPPAHWRKVVDAVVPPFSLIIFFLPMFIWRVFRNLVEVPDDFYFVVSEYNEVVELILTIGIALFIVYQLRRLAARREASS